MLLPLVIAVVSLVVCALALYAMRSKVRFTIRATVAKIFSFAIEVGSQNEGEPGALPAKSAATEDAP
jgi:hypothetical protein